MTVPAWKVGASWEEVEEAGAEEVPLEDRASSASSVQLSKRPNKDSRESSRGKSLYLTSQLMSV